MQNILNRKALEIYTKKEKEREEERWNEKEEKKRKWKTALPLRRIFMYHPDVSSATRIISFFWFFSAVCGLLVLIVFLLFRDDIIIEDGNEMSINYIYLYLIVSSIGALFLSYGLSHFKKWSIFLYLILLVSIFMMKGGIFLGLMGLPGFMLVLLFDYKKFH